MTPFAFFGGATSLVLQTDGKIVAAGVGDGNFALARYDVDGRLDPTFDGDGKASTNIGFFDSIIALVLQPDGKLVAAGLTGGTTTQLAAAARYNADGTLDASFGTGGTLTTDFGGASYASAAALSLDPEGRILVAGTRALAPCGVCQDYVVARYDASGAVDTSFGNNGLVTTDLGGTDALADIARQDDGKIVAAGFASGDLGLARYLGDPTAIEVAVDIRPGGGTNPINLAAKGVVPVGILTTDAFDATTVDPATVCFGDDGDAGRRDCTEAHGTGHAGDIDGDNRADLVLHFEVSETGIDPGDTRACVSGSTRDGIEIGGCDAIVTS